ncbi:hypothetical protein FOXYSP1_14308 [Fusarium oxysporum f. sp. phaseoli]
MDGAASTPKKAGKSYAAKRVYDETIEEEEDGYQDKDLNIAAEGAWTDEETDIKNTDAEDDMNADNYAAFSNEEDYENSNKAGESTKSSNDSAAHLDFAAAEAKEDNAGILGFSPGLNTFLPARSYTSYLSGLIYIQRLIFLEYALPLRECPALGITRRPRTRQLERLEVTRKAYMLCIGITEKHVREVYEPFNRFDDTGAVADRNVVFAWQSGHRPLQRGTTYGLDGAFPTKLQPQLLHLYEWASTRWHEFLHLPSKKLPVHNGDGEPQIQQLREQGAMCQSNRTAVINTSLVSARELLPRMASYGMEGEDERRPTTSSSQHSGFPTLLFLIVVYP